MSTPQNFKYGYVTGLIVSSEGDGLDSDRYPDVVPGNVNVTFTRIRGQYRQALDVPLNGVKSMIVSHKPVVTAINKDGYITSDIDEVRNVALKDAEPGLWLVVGSYKVSTKGLLPDFEIEVDENHTMERPLDISDWIGYTSSKAKEPIRQNNFIDNGDGSITLLNGFTDNGDGTLSLIVGQLA